MLCKRPQLPLTAGLLSYKTSECSRACHWSKLNFDPCKNPISYSDKVAGSSAQIDRDGQITHGLENQYNFGLLKLGTFWRKEGHYFLSDIAWNITFCSEKEACKSQANQREGKRWGASTFKETFANLVWKCGLGKEDTTLQLFRGEIKFYGEL